MKQRTCSVYDARTGERLRRATFDEVEEHFMACSRDNLITGSKLGYPGRKLWVDFERPTCILAWVEDSDGYNIPVFKDWRYVAHLYEFDEDEGGFIESKTIEVKAEVAAAYARAWNAERLDDELTMPAGRVGFIGKRIYVLIPEDEPGLPPDAIVDAWYQEAHAT
jgi:hypothetical protein